jgi:hypothetical protein
MHPNDGGKGTGHITAHRSGHAHVAHSKPCAGMAQLFGSLGSALPMRACSACCVRPIANGAAGAMIHREQARLRLVHPRHPQGSSRRAQGRLRDFRSFRDGHPAARRAAGGAVTCGDGAYSRSPAYRSGVAQVPAPSGVRRRRCPSDEDPHEPLALLRSRRSFGPGLLPRSGHVYRRGKGIARGRC